MCGIVGVLTQPGLDAPLAPAIEAMKGWIRHRGPDSEGTWTDPAAGIGLGHQRLAILDLSPTGAQPMASRSGRYRIVYNGEVYNFPALRRELADAGASFRGTSDTEVILAAFEAWGIEAAVERFVGMFAFALWDAERRELTLTRDRLGIKPLYWAEVGDTVLFASELKAFRGWPDFAAEIDRNALAAFFRWGYVPAPRAIFRDVRKLRPGEIATLAFGRPARLRRYWDARAVAREGLADPLEIDDAEAVERLETVLGDAVAGRMLADVPLGAFLSGGIDSSLVVALMQANSARPVQTYSIGFEDEEFDESGYAAAVARHLGTHHTALRVEPAMLMDLVPRLPLYFDEPFADASAVPTYFVCELARRDITVALSGDGGDELFAGYTRYAWAEMIQRRLLGAPAGLRRAASWALRAVPDGTWTTAARLVPPARRPQRVVERAHKLARYLTAEDGDALYRHLHAQWAMPQRLVAGASEPGTAADDPALRAIAPALLARMQLMDTLTYLPDDILTKVDRASMAVSLEARVPLLDHRVVELAWRLPARFKVRDGESKWLLRRVLERHVPRALIERPKRGFGVPLARWLRGPLKPWAEALLNTRTLTDQGLLEPGVARAAWTAFGAGRGDHLNEVWAVLAFQSWLEHWRQAPAPPATQPRAATG